MPPLCKLENPVAGIKLYLGTQLLQEHPFEGSLIQAGRHPESEIFLEHGNVSRRHAAFRKEGKTWIVEDKGSQNGLFVNGTYTHFHILKDGDRIEIGKYVLFYLDDLKSAKAVASAPAPKPPSAQSNMFRSMDEVLEMIDGGAKDGGAQSSGPMQGGPQRPAVSTASVGQTVEMSVEQIQKIHEHTSKIMDPHVTYFSPSGVKQIVTLKNDINRIGEDQEFEIYVGVAMFANKEAARIVRYGEEYFLEPVGRKSLIKIDGAVVEQKIQLQHDMFFHVHKTRIQFHAGVLQ